MVIAYHSGNAVQQYGNALSRRLWSKAPVI